MFQLSKINQDHYEENLPTTKASLFLFSTSIPRNCSKILVCVLSYPTNAVTKTIFNYLGCHYISCQALDIGRQITLIKQGENINKD